jgi:probable HAF family extracellular repeat protein
VVVETWKFSEAGTLGGGYQESHVFALNDSGVGVGESDVQSQAHACRYESVPPDDLSPMALGGRAEGIANGSPERIVGWADKHAMLWEGSAPTDLNQQLSTHFGPIAFSAAHDVNEAGLIIGNADEHLFTLDIDAQLITEIPIPSGATGKVTSVNAAGNVVGTWSDGTTTSGFFFDGVARADFGPVVDVHDVNDSDAIVGSSGFDLAFLWTPTDGFQDLTASTGLSNAQAINSDGDITGQIAGTPDGQPHAALWTSNQLIDLNSLGPGGDWILRDAPCINKHRQIMGNALYKDNALAFRLDPVLVIPHPRPQDLGLVVAQILFGLVQDGPGFAVIGHHGHPIGPWDPLRQLTPAENDALIGLAIHKLGASLTDPEARDLAQAAGVEALRAAADHLTTPSTTAPRD